MTLLAVWVWNTAWPGLLLGLVCLGLVLRGSVRQAASHARPVRFWRSEVWKLLGTLLLVVTLLLPEHRGVRPLSSEDRWLVWRDQSGSMETRDVSDPVGNHLTRSEWIRAFETNNTVLALGERLALDWRSFGAGETQTDLDLALRASLQEERLAGVLLLSDGDHNAPQPLTPSLLRLAARGVPVFAIAPGEDRSLPDLKLEDVSLPSYALANEPLEIPYRVRNRLRRPVRADLVFSVEQARMGRESVSLEAGGTAHGSFRWVPTAAGQVRVSLALEEPEDDEVPGNALWSSVLDVREETLRVLLVDSEPRWEYRYLRNAMMRDPGVRVDSLLLRPGLGATQGEGYLPRFPSTAQELAAYDVVFLGDVGMGPGELDAQDLTLLVEQVKRQAAGLVFIPGPLGGHHRLLSHAIAELMPVVLDPATPQGNGFDQPMQFWLTREGREHLLTQLDNNPARNQLIWRQLPGFYWYAPALREKAGASVLATHATRRNSFGRVPLLVTRDAGLGKVLFLGSDAAWRWRWGLEDVYHYRFWGQVVRWMAHQRYMMSGEGVRLILEPERPELGQTLRIHGLVQPRVAMGLSAMETLSILLTSPSGAQARLELGRLEDSRSTYSGVWTPEEGGSTSAQVLDPAGRVLLETGFNVVQREREAVGEAVRMEVLREVARVTGGEASFAREADRVLERLERHNRERSRTEVWRLWQQAGWISAVFFCFVLHWVLRKRQGWI